MKALLSVLLLLCGNHAILRAQDSAAAPAASFIQCDRHARKLLEAMQAWRRTHGGEYPERLVQMVEARLIERSDLFCPVQRSEVRNASADHPLSKSSGLGLDPTGSYTYELSPVVDGVIREFMGEAVTRRQIKTELLRRPGWEQVPILRCSVHRDARPTVPQPATAIFRNTTVSGLSYWSGDNWERVWPEYPELGRQALVVAGLRGPPFHRDPGPANPAQLDLRRFYNACGERAWWWGFRYFDPPNKVSAPDLSALMVTGAAGSRELGRHTFWIDGVIQLQGKPGSSGNYHKHYLREMYPWKTSLIPVQKPARSATLLLGCIWEAKEGTDIGGLIWRYAGGSEARSPVIYGQALRRFWERSDTPAATPEPVFQSTTNDGSTVRLYAFTCENPRPAEALAGLVLESNPASPAAPFFLAVTTQ
jgi:hypothetical protein